MNKILIYRFLLKSLIELEYKFYLIKKKYDKIS
jgi:hypothetical protein